MLKLNWNEVRLSGGLGDLEYWMKLSERGMILNATLAIHNVLGYLPQEFGKFRFSAFHSRHSSLITLLFV